MGLQYGLGRQWAHNVQSQGNYANSIAMRELSEEIRPFHSSYLNRLIWPKPQLSSARFDTAFLMTHQEKSLTGIALSIDHVYFCIVIQSMSCQQWLFRCQNAHLRLSPTTVWALTGMSDVFRQFCCSCSCGTFLRKWVIALIRN
jgi:hypothetical protein